MIVYIILLKFRAFGDNGGIDLTDSLTEKAICLVLTALPPHYFKKINRAKRIVGRLRQPPQEQMLFNQGWAPRPAPPREKRAAPPRPAPQKSKSCPAPPRPAKFGKTCGAGRGKVYLNPLKIRPLSVPIRFVRQ